ncbi:DUF6300 family protein [Actinopolymorpha alba]|uniref:DUF6300 family protein n=1 Tax=Actinopolymorpha alba TaxID=533267 RepID=UPI003B50A52C
MSHEQACPRCRTHNLLAVLSLPDTWTNASGNQARVISDVPLCARCDADDPFAGPVVTYFAVHGSAQPETAPHLARCLLRWIEHARPPKPDRNVLNAEAEAWYCGDL